MPTIDTPDPNHSVVESINLAHLSAARAEALAAELINVLIGPPPPSRGSTSAPPHPEGLNYSAFSLACRVEAPNEGELFDN